MLAVPHVRQRRDYTCGPASVASVLRFYGTSASETKVAEEMRASPQLGVSPNAIVRYLRKLGHRCSVRFEMTVEQLERFTRRGHPVIVAYQEWAHRPSTVDYSICWDNGHYSVVVGVVDDHVILVDPSSRRHKRKLDSQSFIAKWRDIETRGDKILRVYSRWGVAVGPRHIRRAENALVL